MSRFDKLWCCAVLAIFLLVVLTCMVMASIGVWSWFVVMDVPMIAALVAFLALLVLPIKWAVTDK